MGQEKDRGRQDARWQSSYLSSDTLYCVAHASFQLQVTIRRSEKCLQGPGIVRVTYHCTLEPNHKVSGFSHSVQAAYPGQEQT
jgi:hypothetical protein